MADQEHVDRLKRSVQEWNRWRREYPEIRPDLSGANLNEAYLSQANLRESDLREADLGETDLFEADLSRSDLFGADLFGADLTGASLNDTNLTGAFLNDTNLTGASLNGANLTRAELLRVSLTDTNLSGTNFTEVHFSYTTFAWVDLSNAKGLETSIHSGPSIVNINSVVLPIEEHTRNHFLRGVGFTETQIEYLPLLLAPRPIQYYSLFISNAHQDEAIARQLHTQLRKHDLPCWLVSHDLRPGNYYREGIDLAIHAQDKLLLLLSEHSINSGWVRYEAGLALSREKRQRREILYPLRLDDAIFHCTEDWAVSLRAARHIGDFTNWPDSVAYQHAFSRLLRDLKVTQASDVSLNDETLISDSSSFLPCGHKSSRPNARFCHVCGAAV